MLTRLREAVAGHHHDTEGAVDRALETSERGMRAIKISLLGLAATAVFQLVIVLVSGSVALLADTIHNFADALTAVPLWIAFAVGRRAANRSYTYGYGRAEDLAGICVLVFIALSAAVAAWESVQRLMAPQPIQNLGWVLVAGVVGFLGNEAVALYRIRIGTEIGSAALVADGHHARTDGLTSLGVVLGAIGVFLGFPQADPLVGLVITVAILFVLKSASTQIFRRLMDAVDPELTLSAERVLAATDGVEGPASVRIRWVGHELWADAEITVDCDRSLSDAHAVAERAQHDLLHELPRLARVTVHVDPCGHGGADHHAATAHHFSAPVRARDEVGSAR
ncbi:MAG TPA: cation diffusion facilitator family transporter [Candidatus Limnocylindria bacterium]|nr:cation diffusion facilitator family transporter [Candidatus Limnocylindria bacterium]